MSVPKNGSHNEVSKRALRVQHREDGTLAILSPGVGIWVEPPLRGTLVNPGVSVGALEVLGRRSALVGPAGASGLVVEVNDAAHTRTAVDFATVLFVLDPEAAGVQSLGAQDEASASTGLVMRAPMSGRYYARPSPDQEPFVSAGDVIEEGLAVGLLEVMKTFNRIAYGGDGLPARAKVVRVVPNDGDDLEAGDALLELEAV